MAVDVSLRPHAEVIAGPIARCCDCDKARTPEGSSKKPYAAKVLRLGQRLGNSQPTTLIAPKLIADLDYNKRYGLAV